MKWLRLHGTDEGWPLALGIDWEKRWSDSRSMRRKGMPAGVAQPDSSGAEEAPSSGGGPLVVAPRWSTRAFHIVHRIRQAAIDDLRARYELGLLVHDLRYDVRDNVPRGTLKEFARLINVRLGTLQRYARVAEMIGAPEFEDYVTLLGPQGTVLTWSHIEELAEARGADLRRLRAEEAVSEALSVNELRARIRDGVRK
jgi:hypothetical protein